MLVTGVSMFSLVTALVSPHAIEALRGKRETLVSTLTENANVLCFQPNDGICLLQGEWENIKKAYAILEEFYFRAQAEIMVREMLKGSSVQPKTTAAKKDFGIEWSNSLLSSLFPLVEQHPGGLQRGNAMNGNEPNCDKPQKSRFGGLRIAADDGAGAEMLNGKDCGGRREDGCSKSTDTDTAALGDGGMGVLGEDRDEDDEDPPILSKEDTDAISLSSEMSDPKEMDFYDTSEALAECRSAGTNHNRVLNGSEGAVETRRHWSDGSNDDEHRGGPPQLTDNRSFETTENVDTKDLRPIPSPISPFEPRPFAPSQTTASSQVATPSLVVGQPCLNSANAFRAQEFLRENLSAGSNKLPQFSSLLFGGATIPQGISAWQYADLYSMHLSALQTMHIKQEPASGVGGGDLAPAPNGSDEEDFKNDLGYRFDDDAPLQEMRCTRCSKTYRSEARMKEHVRTHDKDYVPVLHSCPKCSKSFTYRHNMVVHLRRFHYGWQPAKRHMCRVCGIRFQKPYLLRLHEHKAHVMQA